MHALTCQTQLSYSIKLDYKMVDAQGRVVPAAAAAAAASTSGSRVKSSPSSAESKRAGRRRPGNGQRGRHAPHRGAAIVGGATKAHGHGNASNGNGNGNAASGEARNGAFSFKAAWLRCGTSHSVGSCVCF